MDKSSERGLDQLNTDPNVVQNKSTLPMTGTDSKKMRKIGKIKTGSQFVQLIESRYLINKETQSSDFDQQITPKEMHELIYKMDTEFYSAIAEELSYKALVFLEELGLDSNKIGTMFNLNIMKKFVTKLNETTMSDNKKRDILSMLMYFNKNNLDQCVEQDGSRETDKIYKDTILRANIKEELSGDLDIDCSEEEAAVAECLKIFEEKLAKEGKKMERIPKVPPGSFKNLKQKK